jgi:hypothetical protein
MKTRSLQFALYVFSNTCLPEYAWQVFTAFDEGEYVHPGDPMDFDCETRTRALLAKIVERKDAGSASIVQFKCWVAQCACYGNRWPKRAQHDCGSARRLISKLAQGSFSGFLGLPK